MLTCRPRARASEGWLSISGFSFDGTAEVRTACSADVRWTGTAERAAEGKGAGAAAVLLDESLAGAVLLIGTAEGSLTGAAEGRGAGTAAILLTGAADDSLTEAADGDAEGADGKVADASEAKLADRGLEGGGRVDPLLAGFMT